MSEILEACRHLELAHFSEGEPLLREGTRSGRMFILAEGEVVIQKGMVEVARAATPGALFGEMGALLGTAHTATVLALTDVNAYRVEDVRGFLASNPEVALHAATLLARRLHNATTYLADLKQQHRETGAELAALSDMMDMLLRQPEPTEDVTG